MQNKLECLFCLYADEARGGVPLLGALLPNVKTVSNDLTRIRKELSTLFRLSIKEKGFIALKLLVRFPVTPEKSYLKS